jgi:hypothetical protein
VTAKSPPPDQLTVLKLVGDEFECDLESIRSAIARRALFNLIHLDAIVKVDFVVRKQAHIVSRSSAGGAASTSTHGRASSHACAVTRRPTSEP